MAYWDSTGGPTSPPSLWQMMMPQQPQQQPPGYGYSQQPQNSFAYYLQHIFPTSSQNKRRNTQRPTGAPGDDNSDQDNQGNNQTDQGSVMQQPNRNMMSLGMMGLNMLQPRSPNQPRQFPYF